MNEDVCDSNIVVSFSGMEISFSIINLSMRVVMNAGS